MAYSSTLPEALKGDLQHLYRLTVAEQPILADSLTLSFDEARAPFCELRASAAVPYSQTTLDALDPRQRVRAQLELGYLYADGDVDVEQVADLLLDDRQVRRPANTLDLVAQSDERLVIDQGVGLSALVFNPGLEAYEAIKRTIHRAIPDAPIQDGGLRDGTVFPDPDPFTIQPEDNAFSAILDVADRAGDWWVYDDGTRTWQVTTRPTLASSPRAILTVGEGGTIFTSDSSVGRSAWYNSVVVVHEWTDDNGVARKVRARAEVQSGPLAVADVGRKTQTIRRTFPGTDYTAYRSAASLLRRAVSRGRSLNLEAHADYRLRPGDTIQVRLPSGSPEHHLISAIQFALPSGRMRISTRVPDAYTIGIGA